MGPIEMLHGRERLGGTIERSREEATDLVGRPTRWQGRRWRAFTGTCWCPCFGRASDEAGCWPRTTWLAT